MDTYLEIDPTLRTLAEDLSARGVKYVMGAYTDIQGRSKGKMVPVSLLPNLIAGSERYTPRGIGLLGQMTPTEEECVGIPDPATLQVLPWDERVAVMAADLRWLGSEDGEWPYCGRTILKRQLSRAAAMGYRFNLGVETEIYVFRETGDDSMEPMTPSGRIHPTPGYDLEVTLDSLPFLDPMVEYMERTGFGVFSFDAEGGSSQYEFDFAHDDALAMADRITLFRLMAKQVAKQIGCYVTFMPKPATDSWGSGHHFNMSLEDVDTATNLMLDDGDGRGFGYSKLTYSFVAGIIRHARAIAAIATPTVNSYKRLVPRLQDGFVSWAPVWAAYGYNNRSCMLRLPGNRPAIENRGVDSAANTYMAAAFILAAGLEGIELGLDPGEAVTEQTYDWSDREDAVRLPRTLLEAVDAFEEDPLSEAVFGPRFVRDYVDMKQAEWDEYHSRVSEWERSYYLRFF